MSDDFIFEKSAEKHQKGFTLSLIEDFITQNDICLMNDKSNPFLDSGKGTLSALDLSLCHPSLYLDFDWSV